MTNSYYAENIWLGENNGFFFTMGGVMANHPRMTKTKVIQAKPYIILLNTCLFYVKKTPNGDNDIDCISKRILVLHEEDFNDLWHFNIEKRLNI